MARRIRGRTARRRHRSPRFHHAHGNCRDVLRAHLRRAAAGAESARRDHALCANKREQSLEELAAAQAAALLAETPEANGRKLIVRTFADRDLNSIKLLAQKLTRLSPNTVALLATISPQPSLVFAQSAGQPFDMGSLLKETMATLGGRGGGSKDMAQGGVPNGDKIEAVLTQIAEQLSASSANS